MGKLTKNQKLAAEKIEAGKAYSLKEAAQLVKEITYTKFDASLDIDVRLGVDPRKANQMVRGVVSLPHGTGKVVRVLVLCTPDAEAAAKEAGADYVGLDEYIEKIKGGWTDIDVIITMPSIMGKIGALGRVLGPRGLMPNPKSGTVTMDVAKAVREVKQGKIDFKVDKSGTIIEQIAATVKEYGHFYLVDTTAMNAATTSMLRRECFKADIKLMVVKNTLLHKALESLEEDFSPLYGSLKGTTAVMFSNVANAPAKLIKDKAKNGIPGLKAAYAEESFYVGADQLDALVSIKSKNEVIADIVALLQSPAKNVISALQSGGNTLHGVLKTLGERPEA